MIKNKLIELCLVSTLLVVSTNAAATTYYVDATDGKDSYTGLTPAQAWKTVAKVNSEVKNAGDDVYFLAGEVWYETLTVDWGGTSADRAIVGSYYMKAGSPVIGVPSVTEHPTFQGTCVSKTNCPNKTASAIPTTWGGAMVSIKGNYTTVQELRAYQSSGVGIQVYGNLGENNQFNNNIITDCVVDSAINNAIFLGRTSHTNVVRDNIVTRAALQKPYGFNSNWPAAIGLAGADNSIIEGNYVYGTFGEGIGLFHGGVGVPGGSDNNIIRNNIVVKGVKAGIYVSCSKDNVIEHNKVIGDNTDEFLSIAGGKPSVTAYAAASEDYCHESTISNVFRNNLAANTRRCFGSSIEAGSLALGKTSANAFYNNTCVNHATGLKSVNSTTTAKNNIFTDTDVMCEIRSDVSSVFDYNHYDADPAALGCDGTNDVYGTPMLNVTSGWDDVSATNIPLDSAFDVDSGSSALNAGVALTSTLLAYVDYPQYTLLEGEAGGDSSCLFDLKANDQDHNCDDRSDSTPDIGAFEIGNIPPSQNVVLPFYMNIGGDAIGPLASGKSYMAEAYRSADGAINSYTGSGTDAINATSDDAVYQSWRGKEGTIIWSIPVANGRYDLTLLYQEKYWGVEAGSCTTSGSNRQFDVSVEGALVRDEFDICKLAGAPLTAVRDVIPNIAVADGQLNIELSLGQGTDPKPQLMGLEITVAAPAPSPPTNLLVR